MRRISTHLNYLQTLRTHLNATYHLQTPLNSHEVLSVWWPPASWTSQDFLNSRVRPLTSGEAMFNPSAPVYCCRLMFTGLILGLRPANERRRCFVTTPLIGLAQTQNQHCDHIQLMSWSYLEWIGNLFHTAWSRRINDWYSFLFLYTSWMIWTGFFFKKNFKYIYFNVINTL